MKLPLGITFIILIFVINALTQVPHCDLARTQLSDLRSKLAEKFQAKDYDNAHKVAVEMVKIGETNCQEDDEILLSLNMNVAQIQINRKKLDDAQKIYDQNLERAEKVYGANSSDFQKYTEDLLQLAVKTVGMAKYESYALKLLEAKSKRFGDGSIEFMSELIRTARFYAGWRKYELAEKYFSQAMDVADKLSSDMYSAKLKAINRYRVFLITRYGEKEGLEKDEALMVQKYPDLQGRDSVLNGYAYSLPRPVFSAAARNMKASGEVVVSIKIAPDGRVVSAKATSGHPLLVSEAETAARAAKFLPTYSKGKRVEVTGVITYRFNY